ncbi:chromosome segregation protein SMC [Cohnella lubricantis]|uniref:Chromosome partition protein Smc n=1 Tax=Cohnella lubricantis TaxID=2163172 RepID=A0A841T6J8_9BACL|nr:chromosome segregation protein SMC [Cohnella lubricantis]MBB6677163.1 chromosome segregation protein SMC [Cohnella lubricantis]MBP2117026.1 chromosome segregation protein [Cohnella lubricantis]
MYLKGIELAGFKSFADRTALEFGRGITAVVGPNGSGKSNISDGIRWVLGEQSAKSLRGGNMQDVIFAGSDARKAVNFGEVSITFDNTDKSLPLDFTEVTVTRRVHRSGESEYLINKQPCRLKDITELFMDTGIGKEAYSIIGQGRIEEILSTRSEDRRGIFEEASGIVKYKSRKKEAQRKLEDTEANLLRINDLVVELEGQVEPLREQAEKAEKFKTLKEELKSKEISLYVHQIETVHATWAETNEKLAKLKEEELALSTEVIRHDAMLEEDRQSLLRLEETLERLQDDLLRTSEETEKSEGYGELLTERRANLERSREGLAASLAQAEQRLAEAEAEGEALGTRREQLDRELAEMRERVASEETKLSFAEGDGDAEERLKAELFDTMNAMAQARNDIRYCETQRDVLEKRIGRAEGERAKWQEQLDALSARREELEARLAACTAAVVEARDLYIAAGARSSELQKRLEEAQAEARRAEQRREALVSRRDTIKELQNDYDGFQHGVREVLKAAKRGQLHGVHGAVAELVGVPAHLETAIETALGGALQNIVMENETTSRAAIAYLKQRQSGRATFLPLDVIRPRTLGDGDRRIVNEAEGFVGVASELVKFEARYAGIVGSLLGNVLIAEKLEQANKIASRLQYRYRVVTLEGDVVNPGGSMTGGSLQKKSSNLLGRQRQLEELDRDIAAAEQARSASRDLVDDLKKELAQVSQNIDQLRERGERERLSEQQANTELQQLKNEEKQHGELQAALAGESAIIGDETAKLNAAREEAEARLAQLAQEEKRLQDQIREAEELRRRSQTAKEELQASLTELKVATARLEQDRQAIGEQEARHKAERARLVAERSQLTDALAQNAAEFERTESEMVSQRERLNELRLQKQDFTANIEFKRSDRAERLKQLELKENETKEQRARLKLVEDQLRQADISSNRMDVELDNLLRKLSEEYEIGFEWAKTKYPVPEDVPAAQNEVRELKRKITLLGDVNLGAIEEFKRVSERFEYLSTQKNDLMDAKSKLHEIIREMDDEMSKRFRSTFDEIRKHFVVVFSRLFGGGRADLILSEPDKPLETGIDIVAQPPGKKLQNLQLLSGGERALTAIALLFAILNVKPVPFCVLDEVEAALDEANVARYAHYMREFSELTQFIVVTHRKGTMEEADRLYGVTMEEGGVSKLVSVRLEEGEEMIATA